MAPKSPVEPVAAPAIGVSLQVALSPGRQLVFQTHFDQELSTAEANKLLDRLVMMADRQHAKYDAEGIEQELEKMRRTRQNLLADLERLEIAHKASQEARLEQMGEETGKKEHIYDMEREAWAASGRQGEFKLSHLGKQAVDAHKRAVAALQADFDKAEMERSAELANIRVNIKEWDYQIEKAEAELQQKITLRLME